MFLLFTDFLALAQRPESPDSPRSKRSPITTLELEDSEPPDGKIRLDSREGGSVAVWQHTIAKYMVCSQPLITRKCMQHFHNDKAVEGYPYLPSFGKACTRED